MKTIIFLVPLILFFAGCGEQKSKTVETPSAASTPDTSNLNNPRISIRVNKKYDDKGNLVQFDSSYSYVYSTQAGNTNQVNADSLYYRFNDLLRTQYNNLFERRLNSVFFSDSLFKYDFMNSDYFNKRFELNRPLFEDVFREMDSLKTDLLNRYYPNGAMKEKAK